jgi:hypothetical protein
LTDTYRDKKVVSVFGAFSCALPIVKSHSPENAFTLAAPVFSNRFGFNPTLRLLFSRLAQSEHSYFRKIEHPLETPRLFLGSMRMIETPLLS